MARCWYGSLWAALGCYRYHSESGAHSHLDLYSRRSPDDMSFAQRFLIVPSTPFLPKYPQRTTAAGEPNATRLLSSCPSLIHTTPRHTHPPHPQLRFPHPQVHVLRLWSATGQAHARPIQALAGRVPCGASGVHAYSCLLSRTPARSQQEHNCHLYARP
jgi:hypothetical protein